MVAWFAQVQANAILFMGRPSSGENRTVDEAAALEAVVNHIAEKAFQAA